MGCLEKPIGGGGYTHRHTYIYWIRVPGSMGRAGLRITRFKLGCETDDDDDND